MRKLLYVFLTFSFFLFSCGKVKKELNPGTCSDGIKNKDETGVDCGGKFCDLCPTCTDYKKNQDETDVDCGGVCGPCPTCNDGVQNQKEEGIDCGGPCKECATCQDGIKNQDETGIDCGGTCEPCFTNACNTELGYGENGYLPTGKSSLFASAESFDPDDINDSDFKVTVNADFPLYSGCNGYIVTLYKGDFLKLATNETEVFTTVDYSSNTFGASGQCMVEVFMPMGYLVVKPLQKVYVTRISYSSFNLKFCKLINYPSATYNLNTNFSGNINFTIN